MSNFKNKISFKFKKKMFTSSNYSKLDFSLISFIKLCLCRNLPLILISRKLFKNSHAQVTTTIFFDFSIIKKIGFNIIYVFYTISISFKLLIIA